MSTTQTMPANWSAPTATQRWEYHVARFPTGTKWEQIQSNLNSWGFEGWELINADVERNQRMMGAPSQVTCFLKRQRAAQ